MTVSTTDVAASLGRPLTVSEEQQAALWITDAYLLISVRFGDAYADLDSSLVDYVVRESVAGRLRGAAPGDMSSITVAVDDGNVTRRWENKTGGDSATDWLLDGWLDLLSPERGSGAFSVRPSFEPDVSAQCLDWS